MVLTGTPNDGPETSPMIPHRSLILIALTTATVAWTATAHARPAIALTADGVQTMRVDYADLDVNREAGAKALLARLQRAAGEVCGPRVAAEAARYRACVKTSVATAVRDVAAPRVTALHRGAALPQLAASE